MMYVCICIFTVHDNINLTLLKQGMFAILDEECLRPGAEDDKRVVIHMDKALKSNDHYFSHANRAKNLKNQQEFQVG